MCPMGDEKKQISKLRQKGNGSAKKKALNGGREKAVIEDGMRAWPHRTMQRQPYPE